MTPWEVISRTAPIITELKCSNCGAPLAIISRQVAECEYCSARFLVSNMDEIVMDTKSEVVDDYWDDPDDMYFCDFRKDRDSDYFFRGDW